MHFEKQKKPSHLWRPIFTGWSIPESIPQIAARAGGLPERLRDALLECIGSNGPFDILPAFLLFNRTFKPCRFSLCWETLWPFQYPILCFFSISCAIALIMTGNTIHQVLAMANVVSVQGFTVNNIGMELHIQNKKAASSCGSVLGGAYRNRTGDLLPARQAILIFIDFKKLFMVSDYQILKSIITFNTYQ